MTNNNSITKRMKWRKILSLNWVESDVRHVFLSVNLKMVYKLHEYKDFNVKI